MGLRYACDRCGFIVGQLAIFVGALLWWLFLEVPGSVVGRMWRLWESSQPLWHLHLPGSVLYLFLLSKPHVCSSFDIIPLYFFPPLCISVEELGLISGQAQTPSSAMLNQPMNPLGTVFLPLYSWLLMGPFYSSLKFPSLCLCYPHVCAHGYFFP